MSSFPGVKRPEREAGQNYVYCVVKERVKMYFSFLYVFIALRENIEIAVALAVLRLGTPPHAAI
jgi:hypothetical protein